MFERIFVKSLFIFAALAVPFTVAAQDAVNVPDYLQGFVEKGRIPVSLESGDMNADGHRDFVLVLSDVVPEDKRFDEGAGERTVLIIIGGTNKSYTLAGRNDLVAMCKSCGGAFGDPFEGVVIKGGRFTVMNYGGSAQRWAYSYTFGYSGRDRTWQLVRVEESNFHTLDPDRTMKRKIYTAPRHFGLINFADFDPDNFQGKGKK